MKIRVLAGVNGRFHYPSLNVRKKLPKKPKPGDVAGIVLKLLKREDEIRAKFEKLGVNLPRSVFWFLVFSRKEEKTIGRSARAHSPGLSGNAERFLLAEVLPRVRKRRKNGDGVPSIGRFSENPVRPGSGRLALIVS